MRGYIIKYRKRKLIIIIDSNLSFSFFSTEIKFKPIVFLKDGLYLHKFLKSLAWTRDFVFWSQKNVKK
jgi:hypothetical protein